MRAAGASGAESTQALISSGFEKYLVKSVVNTSERVPVYLSSLICVTYLT